MKRHTILLFLMLGTVAAAPAAWAQDAPRELRTRFMIMNRHQCPQEHMDEVMAMVHDTIAPTFDAMKQAGEIDDWGVLLHEWGDEYNFNFYFITADHRSFLDAWDAMLRRNTERDPDWLTRWAPLCTQHKDNLFTLHDYE